MKAPTRFFLVCIGLSALAIAGNYLYVKYLDSRLSTATAACESESKRLADASAVKYNAWLAEFGTKAEDYAAWIVKNKDKKGTEEFEIVARAYQEVKADRERWLFDQTGGLDCEPYDLATAGYDLDKIRVVQKEVVAAYRSKVSFGAETVGVVSVVALLFLGILPHAWFFLLRRLREVSASIRGE